MIKPAQPFFRALLLLITLAGFGLRVWGLEFGLPFVYHPDEQQYIIPAMGVVGGNFEPQAHYNPALYPYLLGAIYSAVYWSLRLFDAFPPDFNINSGWLPAMQPWVTGIFYLARYVTAGVGVLTTLLVYRLGKRAYGPITGLGAALIYGLTFLPVREAHFAVSDAPVALAVTAALYLFMGVLKRGRPADYLGSGLALGLAAAVKYSAGLLVLPLIVAHLLSYRYSGWQPRLRGLWRLALAGLVSLAAYALASPYTLLEYDEFWAQFSDNLNSARAGFAGLDLDPAGGLIFYLKGLMWGLGWPIFGLFLAAVLFALLRRRRVDLLLLTLPLLGFIYMQRQEMYFVRWLMPFIPPMAVLAAETARASLTWPATRRRPTLSPTAPRLAAAIWLLLLLMTLPSTYTAAWAGLVWSRPDTRTEALNWLRDNVPPQSGLAVRLLSPPWGPPLMMPGLDVGPYNFAPVPQHGVGAVDVEQYRAWGVEYIVSSSYNYAQPLLDKTFQRQLTTGIEAIDQNAELIATFQPYHTPYQGYFYHDQVYGPANDTLYRRQPGPIIKIYRLP